MYGNHPLRSVAVGLLAGLVLQVLYCWAVLAPSIRNVSASPALAALRAHADALAELDAQARW